MYNLYTLINETKNRNTNGKEKNNIIPRFKTHDINHNYGHNILIRINNF